MTVTPVPRPASVRSRVIVIVPAYDGSSASNTARRTTRTAGLTGAVV
ncbi:hypothetical protein ABT144_22640 [Streptomyces sp. NPDC002039]